MTRVSTVGWRVKYAQSNTTVAINSAAVAIQTSGAIRINRTWLGCPDLSTPPVDASNVAADSDREFEFAESDSIANARSLADWNLSRGFFSKQRRNTRSRPGENWRSASDASVNSAGSSFRIAFNTSIAVFPWKARLPVNIS